MKKNNVPKDYNILRNEKINQVLDETHSRTKHRKIGFVKMYSYILFWEAFMLGVKYGKQRNHN